MALGEGSAVGGIESPAARAVALALAAALTIGSVGWALDAQMWLDLIIYPAQYFAGMLALALPLVYIVFPARRGRERRRVPWYDWACALAGFVALAYITWEYQRLVDLVLLRPPDAVIAGAIVLALSLEGLRRSTGNTLPITALAFVAYALLGDALPGRAGARPTDVEKLVAYLSLDVNGILGLPLGVAVTIVIAFLFFGQLLAASGGSQFFTEIAMLTMGRFRGGPAKIAVVGSGLFGSISGSAVANVVATGVVTIPMIKRSGYPAHRAGAIEAAASTGGQMMPPVMGASAFLMAEFLQISYAEVVLAALVPALLYYVALFLQADLEAARRGAARVAGSEIPPAAGVLRGLHFLLPFVVLVVALFSFNQPPQLAALLAAAAVLLLALAFGYHGRRPGLGQLLQAISGAGFAVLDIVMVCVAAGIVIGVLGISGLGFNLTLVLVQIGQGNLLLLLLLAAIVCIVLGMGLPTVGVYVLLAALVAPALVEVGVTAIGAHLYVLYFGMMSMITPPVAIAAFAAAGLAGANPMRTGFSAVQFAWIAYVVPVLFVLSPELLLIGAAGDIVRVLVTAVIGVWLVSIGAAGYFMRPIGPLLRVVFVGTGLAALLPGTAFDGAVFVELAGVVLGALLIGLEWVVSRNRGQAAVVNPSEDGR
ncbi:MAG: TRAP transporter fused permease subunit [Burkholderiales bacterium]|nr:MAG: TRAP transporter fused permease subunit [Burkholderiales bacterium]